jgi:hypothetical protein
LTEIESTFLKTVYNCMRNTAPRFHSDMLCTQNIYLRECCIKKQLIISHGNSFFYKLFAVIMFDDMIIPWSNGWRMLVQSREETQLSHSLGIMCLEDKQNTSE